MKSFKQFDESHSTALNSAEDDNLGLFNVQDERVMQRLNGFVGAIAQQEYMQPKIESDKGNATVELTQFGGRYGKISDNSNGPMSDGKEIENGDGISHKKDGGLKIEFNWEKQNNNQFMVSASLK